MLLKGLQWDCVGRQASPHHDRSRDSPPGSAHCTQRTRGHQGQIGPPCQDCGRAELMQTDAASLPEQNGCQSGIQLVRCTKLRACLVGMAKVERRLPALQKPLTKLHSRCCCMHTCRPSSMDSNGSSKLLKLGTCLSQEALLGSTGQPCAPDLSGGMCAFFHSQYH